MFAIDRGGLVGADSATHHGAFDLSFLLCVPNMVIMTPSDENECRQMLQPELDQPAAVYTAWFRLWRDATERNAAHPHRQGQLRRQGQHVAILAFGCLLHEALAIADQMGASVANMRFAKPIDTELVESLARSHELIVTLEENATISGVE